MWKVLSFLNIIIVVCYAAPDIIPRIINGTDAKEGEFKFVVSIKLNGFHNCGGTILNQRHILTAAHCVCNDTGSPNDPNDYTIQYGSVKISETDERTVPVDSIACNDFLYDLHFYPNDIAVVKLAHDIPEDGTWEAVKIPENYNATSEGKGVIVGWGFVNRTVTTSHTLQKLEVDIYNDTVCGRWNQSQHICLGGHGTACFGDSGTSLTNLDNVQVGITSFSTSMCKIANRTYPNVYTRVNNYFTWIVEQSKL